MSDALTGEGPGAAAYNIVGLAQQGKNHAYETVVSGCLQHKGLNPTGNEAGTVIAFAQNQREEVRDLGDLAGAVKRPGTHEQTFVATSATAFQERGRDGGRVCDTQEDLAYALLAPAGGGRRQENNIQSGMTVRRLTPTECLRLMALPDWWLDVDPPLSDPKKYHMIGNSGVVHILAWIAGRILKADGGS